MPRMNFLTDADVVWFKRLVRFYRGLGNSRQRFPHHDNDHQAPETYIAKAPSDGIPAFSDNAPGFADCEIYKVIGASVANPTIALVTSAKKRVYNLTLGSIPAETLFSIVRDKFGHWIANVGASAQTVRWGRAQTRKGYFERVKVSVWENGPPQSGPLDPDEYGSISSPLQEIDCITTYPTLVGCPGSITPITSYNPEFGEGAPFEFRPYMPQYLCHANSDWTSGGVVAVTLDAGFQSADTGQVFNAVAPTISGVGMSGVLGEIKGVMGQAAHWLFVPLGCIGTSGTGSGS